MATANDDFDQDFDAYQRELPRLLRDEPGRFALVGRREFVRTFASRDEAMHAGYAAFGLRGFLVQEVRQADLLTPELDQQTCRS